MNHTKAQAKMRRLELDEIQERIEREDPYRPVWQLALIAVGSAVLGLISLPVAAAVFLLSALQGMIFNSGQVFERGARFAYDLVVYPWEQALMLGNAAASLPYRRFRRAVRRKFVKA